MQLKPIVFTVVVLAAAAAHAQSASPPASTMPGMAMPATPVQSPSTQAFKDADERMMKGMGAPMSGDTDQDFTAGMIPHHQGAVDMAEVELKYGNDPDLRKLARDIVEAQQKEIAFMTAWRRAHPPVK